tara:strand:- start:2308 stop:3747 length:1440 start_codon:yes stop_codon:yes gene_type:complete
VRPTSTSNGYGDKNVRREKYVILFYLYSDPITKLPNIPHNVWRTEFCGLSEKQKLNDTPLEVRKGIKWAFAEYIHRVKAEFPFKKSKDTEDDIRKLFLKFVDKSTKNEIQYNFSFYLRDEEGEPLDPPVERSSDIDEKFDYKYKYKNNPLGVINKSHAYNKVSDYFQEENRMDCGSNSVDSPLEIWYNKDKLAQMNWHWFRKGAVGTCNIDEKRIRSGFRLGTYIATQFRPMAAKTIFDKYEAVNVVDTSCGWGDRLAGFYASKSTKLYVGCDPNPAVFKAYKEQCKFYEETLEGKLFEPDIIDEEKYFELRGVNKTVKIWNLPSEDVDWSQYHDTFDLYFSSPPYFDTEKYGQGKDGDENQSWSRYQTFEKWKKFFFGVTKKVCKTLQPNGKMLINIIEPRTKKGTRHNLCDNMVDYLTSETNCDYEGKLGLRMMGRPNSELKEYRNEVGDVIGYGKPGLQGCVIEPIWVFKNEVRKV